MPTLPVLRTSTRDVKAPPPFDVMICTVALPATPVYTVRIAAVVLAGELASLVKKSMPPSC